MSVSLMMMYQPHSSGQQFISSSNGSGSDFVITHPRGSEPSSALASQDLQRSRLNVSHQQHQPRQSHAAGALNDLHGSHTSSPLAAPRSGGTGTAMPQYLDVAPPFHPSDTPQTSSSTTTSPAPSAPPTPASAFGEMLLQDTSNQHVEIQLPNDTVTLKGVGTEVEPQTVTGNVVLSLEEATNIREVTLTLTGKARIPSPVHPSAHSSFRQHTTTITLVSRDWSFLKLIEGQNKSHKHTLNAGQHVFPFSFTVDHTFPSSIAIPGASIVYKLRASIIRSAFTSNWVSTRHLYVVRSFIPEALEYTQTVEVENTWPGKIMYSILIPQKAYAGGDSIPALLKFTPIAKGCKVLQITGDVREYISIKHGTNPSINPASRIVGKCRYELVAGMLVDVLTETLGYKNWLADTHGITDGFDHFVSSAGNIRRDIEGGVAGASSSAVVEPVTAEEDDGDLEVWIKLPIWKHLWPTSSDEPITIHYKMKWSIMISNLDGHVSELRASLPIHILHHSQLAESRAASHLTRSLLFGNNFEPAPTEAVHTLPSYASHVHDRIANALDPTADEGVQLVPNPLRNSAGPVDGEFILGTFSNGPSTRSSGYETPSGQGYFPAARSSGTSSHASTPAHRHSPPLSSMNDPRVLEQIDQGLLLSLGISSNEPLARSDTMSTTDTTTESRRSSLAIARFSSQHGASATATTPEHEAEDLPSTNCHTKPSLFGGLSLKPFTSLGKNASSSRSTSSGALASLASASLQSSAAAAPVAISPPASRPSRLGFRKSSFQNLRDQPCSSGSSNAPHPHRKTSHHNLRHSMDHTGASSSSSSASHSHTQSLDISRPSTSTMSDLLSRVPDYQRAVQGFLGGGVPPLESSRDLPLYDEISQGSADLPRVQSEPSLMVRDDTDRTLASRLQQRTPEVDASPDIENEMPRISVTAASSRSASRMRHATFTLEPVN